MIDQNFGCFVNQKTIKWNRRSSWMLYSLIFSIMGELANKMEKCRSVIVLFPWVLSPFLPTLSLRVQKAKAHLSYLGIPVFIDMRPRLPFKILINTSTKTNTRSGNIYVKVGIEYPIGMDITISMYIVIPLSGPLENFQFVVEMKMKMKKFGTYSHNRALSAEPKYYQYNAAPYSSIKHF